MNASAARRCVTLCECCQGTPVAQRTSFTVVVADGDREVDACGMTKLSERFAVEPTNRDKAIETLNTAGYQVLDATLGT